jgi:AmmeMemoRadiSam system protein B
MQVREPAFAGSWYPDTADGCRREIETFLEERPLTGLPRPPLAGIVPHAGWFFSGSLACHVIGLLQGDPPSETVVVFGMHMHPASKPVIMTTGAWRTPLGDLPIDLDLAGHLAAQFAFEIETPRTPNRDNTIELQLPFIRHFFGEVPIVPIGVPPSTEALRIADAVVTYAQTNKRRIKIIGSTDLTHYGPNYAFTRQGRGDAAVKWVREDNDRRFIDALLALAPGRVIDEALRRQNACCAGAAAACLEAAMGLGAREGQLRAYTTSHDKSPGDSFVGYAGVVYF